MWDVNPPIIGDGTTLIVPISTHHNRTPAVVVMNQWWMKEFRAERNLMEATAFGDPIRQFISGMITHTFSFQGGHGMLLEGEEALRALDQMVKEAALRRMTVLEMAREITRKMEERV